MSTTGIIGTDGNWYLNQPAPLKFNYSQLTRLQPQYSKSISFGGGSTTVTLFNNGEITDAGIYMCTVAGDFSSTPWNLRVSFYLAAGYGLLTSANEVFYYSGSVHSVHADNGSSYLSQYGYQAVSTNYQQPGIKLNMGSNMASGTINVKLYRVASI